MLSNIAKFAGISWLGHYCYNNYLKESTGVFDTVAKIARDVLKKPEALYSEAEKYFESAEICYQDVEREKIANLKKSALNPMKYMGSVKNGWDSLSCTRKNVFGAFYLGASLVASSVVLYSAYNIASYSWPICKQLASKLSSLIPAKSLETQAEVKVCYAKQIKEFKEIYAKLHQQLSLELFQVLLKGDLPVVELKLKNSQVKLTEILKQADVGIKSFEMSSEGECLKIHLETHSNMDLCIVF